MSDIKAVLCIDLDGTLVDSNQRVHPDDIRLLENFPKHIQPILTTGRILHSARRVLQENGLFQSYRFPLPGVFMNGGTAYLPDENLCTQHTFSPHTRETLLSLAHKYWQTSFTFFSLEVVYLVNANHLGRHISRLHYLASRESATSELPRDIVKVMILDQDVEKLETIKRDIQDLDAEMAYSLSYAFEINPPGITKAGTLITLLKTMQMQALPVFVAGDAENDLSLFNIAKLSFVPDTANSAVQTHADHIIQYEKSGLLSPILEQIDL